MTIGERIRKRREQMNFGLTELAEKVNITKQALYKYENDIVTNIPSNKIEELAKALNTTPAYLMGWDEDIHIANTKLPIISEGADLSEAIKLFEAYSKANPDVQAAVEILLKSHLSDS